MDLDNIFWVTVQQTKVEDFAINADLQNIIIRIVQNKHMSLLIVFTVVKKVILQENALIMRKVYIEREDLASDVGL